MAALFRKAAKRRWPRGFAPALSHRLGVCIFKVHKYKILIEGRKIAALNTSCCVLAAILFPPTCIKCCSFRQINIIRTFIQSKTGSDLLFISSKLKIGKRKNGRTAEHGNPPAVLYSTDSIGIFFLFPLRKSPFTFIAFVILLNDRQKTSC